MDGADLELWEIDAPTNLWKTEDAQKLLQCGGLGHHARSRTGLGLYRGMALSGTLKGNQGQCS